MVSLSEGLRQALIYAANDAAVTMANDDEFEFDHRDLVGAAIDELWLDPELSAALKEHGYYAVREYALTFVPNFLETEKAELERNHEPHP